MESLLVLVYIWVSTGLVWGSPGILMVWTCVRPGLDMVQISLYSPWSVLIMSCFRPGSISFYPIKIQIHVNILRTSALHLPTLFKKRREEKSSLWNLSKLCGYRAGLVWEQAVPKNGNIRPLSSAHAAAGGKNVSPLPFSASSLVSWIMSLPDCCYLAKRK